MFVHAKHRWNQDSAVDARAADALLESLVGTSLLVFRLELSGSPVEVIFRLMVFFCSFVLVRLMPAHTLH